MLDQSTASEPSGQAQPRDSLDAYTPQEIAARVEKTGIAKAALPALDTLVLAVLAGAFIAFGAMFFTLVMTGSPAGFGPGRLLGALAFSLGLILVVVAGAELFTGNNLIVMAWAHRRVSTARLLRNWGLVYLGNMIGAVATAVMAHAAGLSEMGGGALGELAVRIAVAKAGLPFVQAFASGMLCNTLVCLALWMCFAAHSVAGKILAIVFPISAFVALGFEHSVANMYFLPAGLLAAQGPLPEALGLAGLLGNLVPVTLGNIVGGSVLVALVYWLLYLRKA